jgi:hypothetical protein
LLSAASRTGRGVVGARTYNRRGTFNVAVDIVGPGGGCDVALSAARVRNHL